MRTIRLAVFGTLISPAFALAENNGSTAPHSSTPDVQGWMVASRPGFPDDVMQVLPPTNFVPDAGTTQILYLNHTGTTLRPSDTNDSRNGNSTLVSQTTAVPAWTGTSAQWAQVLSCEQNMWSRFNVQVTDQDPGTTPHIEAIFTTYSSVLGMDPNVGGVSPFTIGCDVIPNSIVFTFASAFQNDPETVCEVMAQEMAHSYGLDHELLAADPMTYLDYNGLQGFQDQSVSCGEYQTRQCGLQGECGGAQDSVSMLLTRVGPAAPGGGTNGAPTVQITSPSNGAQVPPGFTVAASATDDGSVSRVELWIDGQMVDTRSAAPFSFQTDASLSEGQHQIQTMAYDDSGQSSTASIDVTVQVGAPDPGNGTDPGAGGTQDPSELVGGCSTTGGGASFLLLGLALGGLVIRRRK